MLHVIMQCSDHYMSRPLKYDLLWLTILDQEASVYDMNKNIQSYNNIQSIKNAIHQN